MTLYIIGMGIYGEPSIPHSYYKLIREVDKVYLETYTSPLKINIGKLKEIFNVKDIIPIDRGNIEENDELIREASKKDVVILISGDPLIATTHTTLVLESMKNGIDIKVIHSSSALCAAIGESGLHTYKFGPSCTLIRSEKGSSLRCYQILKDNIRRGLHTLFFLEYNAEENYAMAPKEGIEILIKYDVDNLISDEQYVIVLCALGSEAETKKALKIKEVIHNKKKLNGEPCILIFPGELHFTEEEYLKYVLEDDHHGSI